MATTAALTTRPRTLFGKIIRNHFFYSLLLALLCTLISHYSLYFTWSLTDQSNIADATGYKKSMQRYQHQKDSVHHNPIADDFLLIDVSNDLALHCDSSASFNTGTLTDTDTPAYIPCVPEIDLPKLTALFKWLSDNPNAYNVVVCDLFIDTLPVNKATDSLLGHILHLIQYNPPGKALFASLYNEHTQQFTNSAFTQLIPPAYRGAVNEDLVEDKMLTYTLSYQNMAVKSLPLLMLEHINHYTAQPGIWGFNSYQRKDGSKYTAGNLFIPEMLYSNDDIDSLRPTGSFSGRALDPTAGKIELWQTLLRYNNTPNYALTQVLDTLSAKKRNIFIGSFNHRHTDMHKTLYGDMDGATILLNTYYNLVAEGNKISMFYYVWVFVFFAFTFLKMLVWPNLAINTRVVFLNALLHFLYNNAQYWLLPALTFLLSYYFNKAANSLVLFGLLFTADNIIQAYRQGKESAGRI